MFKRIAEGTTTVSDLVLVHLYAAAALVVGFMVGLAF